MELHISVMSCQQPKNCFLEWKPIKCLRSGLHLNAKKIKYMAYNLNSQGPLMSSNGNQLKQTKDFKYLGLRMESTERDIKERKASVWISLSDLPKIWT